ncbi:MAG TPA: hypothetical protein VGU01_04575 [Sphingomicrobium sp.]|nr:hypothetical protein [Sphingomicrobium sp.]
MTFELSARKGAFADRKPINSEELRALRSEVWGDGSVSASEAEKLFSMNRLVEPSSAWTEFFVEAICEFMLSQGEPRGYVTEDEATWLLRQVNCDGHVGTPAELELIVKLLERAEYAPGSLRRFALGTIEQTVLTGEGPSREGTSSDTPRIEDSEAALIRRLIFAPASDGPAKVSATEAEMLFRLKDATIGQDNSPEWKKLFVQGVANYLMAHQSYRPPSPSDEVRLEARYESRPFNHLLAHLHDEIARPREIRDALFGENEDEAIDKLNQKIAADAAVTSAESSWLKRLYNEDGKRDEFEQALLDFLAEDGARPF